MGNKQTMSNPQQSTRSLVSQANSIAKLPLIMKHECTLPPEDDIVVKYISSGYFVHLRRFLRKITMVYTDNPQSIAVLRSTVCIEYEKRRHLRYYYYTIHPFSIARAYYERVFMVVLIISLVVIPIETAVQDFTYLELSKTVLDICFLFDCVITFFTGYFDKETKKIILRKKRIAAHYVSTLFAFDLMSSVNPHFFVNFWNLEISSLLYLKLFNFFKVLRLPTTLQYMDSFNEWHQYSTYKFKVFKLIYVGIVCTLWAACLLYFLALYTEEPFLVETAHPTGLHGFMICFLRIIQLLLLVGFGQIGGKTSLVLAFEIMMTVIGAVFVTYTFAQILQIVNKYNSCANKYFQLTQSLEEYSSYMKLPEALKQKIIVYFDFKFQKKYFKESEIMATISEQLKNAIVLHRSKNLLQKVAIFKDLPPSLLVSIVTAMKSVIYLPNDVIVEAESEGDTMFFILTGTVAIYTKFGKEVCHLADGSNFGEIALVMAGEKRVASVVAVDPCELLSLSRRDFTKAIEPYPDLYERIRTLAQSRLTKTMEEIQKEEDQRKSFSLRISRDDDKKFIF